MKNIELLFARVKKRIYERSEYLLFDILGGNILFFAICGAGYFWLDGILAEYVKSKNMNSIFPFLMMICLGSFMAASLLNICRTVLAHVKMKWFKHSSLRFTIFYSYDFIDTIKLSKEENQKLFEMPLTKECLLYLVERIKKVGHLDHDDLHYVYHNMKGKVITEDNTLLIEKVKEFFEYNNIDINHISKLDSISDNIVHHHQVMNGKKDLKKFL